MNLAPVEQYFADYLSTLETREWVWSNDDFTYRCDSLLKNTVFNGFVDDERFAVQNNHSLHDAEKRTIFQVRYSHTSKSSGCQYR